MRSRDFYWLLALIGGLALLVFLSFNLWQTLNFQEESSLPVLFPVSPAVTSSSNLEEVKAEELFLASYPEGKLAEFRDLFQPAISIAEEREQEPVAALPQEAEEEVAFLPPQEFVPPQAEVEAEPLPAIHLQGVVRAGPRQAVIVEVEGKVQILTNEKDQSSGIKLVKVEGEEVVLSYEGREIRLTLAE